MFVQKIKKSIFNLLVLAQLVAPLPAIAGGDLRDTKPSAANEMLAASGDLLIESLNRYGDKINMKWVNGGFRAESNGEYSFDLKAFSVIREYAKQVFFTQYGLSKDGDASTLNAGLGFYHLLANNIMIGGNAFYDARTGTEGILNPFGEGVHKRFSVGGTIMTSQAGMFFNVYRGLSDSIARYKVSDGYDFGINGLVPGYESVNLGVTHYNFNEETQGNKFKVEYKPNSLFTFGVEQDQSDNPNSSLYVETKYEFNKPLEEQLQSTARVSGDVWSKRYNEVERDNKITLELAVVDFEMATPTRVPYGATVYLKPLAIGGGDGELSFEEVVADDDVTVDTDAGTVTSSKVAEVDVKVTRAALGGYNKAIVTVEVIFTEKGLTLVDGAADKGLLTSKQGEGEGFGVDLTKAIVTVGTGDVSYAIKTDEDEEDKSKMVSSPMVNHIGKAVPASHPLGASITDKGLVTATKGGTVSVVVSQKGDVNYEASELDVDVTFSKSRKGIEVEVPKSVEWDKSVELMELVSGGGEGKLSFKIKEGAENTIDANVTQDGGIVTAVGAGTIEVTVKREEDSNYEVSTQDVTVTFGRKTEDLTGLTEVRTSPINTSYTIDGIIGTDISDGDLTYELKGTNPSDMGTVLVIPTTGEITGVTTPGEVTVTVTRKGNANYEQVSGDVTITYFIDGVLSVTDQGVLDAQIWHNTDTFNLADYIAGGGELKFTGLDTNDDEKDIQVTPTGEITAKVPGVFGVNVHRAQKDGYSEDDLEVTVTFGKQDSTIDVENPDVVLAGTPSQINVTGVGGQSFKYTKNTEKTKIEADVGLESGVVDSKVAGSVFVIVTHEGTEKYNLETQEVEVTFREKTTVEFTIDTQDEVESGEAVEVSKLVHMPEGVETGTLSYAIEGPNNIGAELNENTGHLTATGSGPVRIVVTREEDDDYKQSSKFIDIVFSFFGKDSKARLSLDDEVVLKETMKVNYSGDEVAGYKQIRTHSIRELHGYDDYGQSWHISSSGHKDWNLEVNAVELVRAQNAQIAGEAVFPNCSYGTEKETCVGGHNPQKDYIYVKDGAKCSFDVTFFRKGNYKGKTVKVDFLAADTARAATNGYIVPKVKLDDTAETRSTGTKVFRKINLASTNKLRNPDSQELIYTGSDFSFQPNGSLWEESHLTDAFLEGLEQNCVVASGNIMYLKEHSVCHGHVRFVENANYLSKLMEITVTSKEYDNTSTFGNKFKFIGSSDFPGADDVTGVYGVNVKTGFARSQLNNVAYTLSGPDVETGEGGIALHWDSRGTVINKINNVEKCIFVQSKNYSSQYNDRLLLIKKGVTCNITVNFPSTRDMPEKTEQITVTAKGISTNPSTIGNLSYTAQWEAKDDSFKYVEMLDLERKNGFYINTNSPDTIINRRDYRYTSALNAIVYSSQDLHSDSGKPFPNGTTLDSLGKNCMIISSDSVNEGNPPVFYVKKGTSCAIDVTFPATDNFLGKTETLTLSANDD